MAVMDMKFDGRSIWDSFQLTCGLRPIDQQRLPLYLSILYICLRFDCDSTAVWLTFLWTYCLLNKLPHINIEKNILLTHCHPK